VSFYLGGHAGFLVVAIATHAVVGYALGAVAFDRAGAGLVGGVAADVDLLVPAGVGEPLVHRGVTHGLFALGVATAVGLALGRATAGAVGIGYCSQLLIDATTPMGVPLLSPVLATHFGVDAGVGGHSVPATLALWVTSAGLLLIDRRVSIVRSTET